jgi:hypothetical protein
MVNGDAFQKVFPPDAPVSDQLAIHFSKEHVGLRVTVNQVAVGAGHIVHVGTAFNTVFHLAGGDQVGHMRIIRLPSKTSEGESLEGGSIW